eukprot:CAMPEP_0202885282 /NCGR_PEP_ID=MMETSP1391-20130828/41582_1 /ASSEMBLY_ACC=CAM_ASM_000867 /TAXON_ID=1034604 /ORGANISM="Chlamydomonas leiostraca, Strain SAG 11-49" /LENGTH=1167 /DNA_ID=CAMNT_0049568525 /DNA_START=90 /DNA_END=3594 /DNA_ORIENTATION=-
MASLSEVIDALLPRDQQSGDQQSAGLFVQSDGKPVPLRSRSVSSTIHCDTAFVATTETFKFLSDEDVSVVFKFPLPPRAAVHRLTARIGERVVVQAFITSKPSHKLLKSACRIPVHQNPVQQRPILSMASSFTEVVEGLLPNGQVQSMQEVAGLFIKGDGKPVPLRSRAVKSTIHCDTAFAATTETFTFLSDEDVSVVFKFPLPPRAAVHRLTARIGERVVVTEVKPKEEAREEYATAVSQGHTAVLAQGEASSQVFSLELGNLAAGVAASVEVGYLRLLDAVGGALEYVHTATWTPPYTGAAGDGARGAAATLEQNPRFAPAVTYTLAYDVRVLARRGVAGVEANQAVTVQEWQEGGCAGKRVVVEEAVGDPSKDFTLLVDLTPVLDSKDQATAPGSVAGPTGSGHISVQECARPAPGGVGAPLTKRVALATFVPRLPGAGAGGGGEGEGEAGATPSLAPEIVFVVDCSGSMSGARIEQARQAALFFIQDLPAGARVRFNVVAFGSGHKACFPECREYTADTRAQAVAWVQSNVHADMGGTEILATLQSVYATPVPAGYARTLLFLTDGGISGGEEAAVFDLVAAGSAGAGGGSGVAQRLGSALRKLVPGGGDMGGSGEQGAQSELPPAVLCLGIGHGVHRGLLDGIASRSGGCAQYVADGESITRKAGFLKKAALAGAGGCITRPRLVARGAMVRAAPHVLPPRLFPGEPLHMLVEIVQSDAGGSGAVLELVGERAGAGAGGAWSLALPLSSAPVAQGEEYAVLHGMCWVASLLAGTSPLHVRADGSAVQLPPAESDVRAAVVRAACAEHLVTRHTAAVGVLLQHDPLDPAGVKRVEVPLAVPHGAIHFGGRDSRAEQQEQLMLFGAMPMPCCAPAPQSLHFARCAAPKSRAAGPGAMFGAVLGAAAAPFKKMSFGGGSAAPPPPAPAMCFSAAPAAASAPTGMVYKEMAARRASIEEEEECCDDAVDLFGAAADETAPAEGAAMMEVDDSPALSASVGKPKAEEAKRKAKKMSAGIRDMEAETMSWAAEETAAVVTGKGGAAAAGPPLSPDAVLALLNLRRGVEGCWGDDGEVVAALVSQLPAAAAGADAAAAAVAAARAARPAGLSCGQWASVLALAFLRKHCGGQRGVWEAMEAKALAHLAAGWPAEAKPLGFTILAALKLV